MFLLPQLKARRPIPFQPAIAAVVSRLKRERECLGPAQIDAFASEALSLMYVADGKGVDDEYEIRKVRSSSAACSLCSDKSSRGLEQGLEWASENFFHL